MKSLSGHTKPFAVLGHPIGHTLSPVMHNAAFAELDMDAVYLAFDVSPVRLLAVLRAMRDMGFVGVNLTVPHKEAALRGLTQLDDSARLLGAANTVKFTENGAVGFNTDGYGFLRAFVEAFETRIEGRSMLILGAGGAGRAVALVSAREGAASVTLAEIDEARAQSVAMEIDEMSRRPEVTLVTNTDAFAAAAREAEVVVHATPIGMKKTDVAVLGPDAFREGQCVFDLIYHFPQTPIMESALAGGARVSNGLGMLLHQGARAFEIWTGQDAPEAVMRATLERAVYGDSR